MVFCVLRMVDIINILHVLHPHQLMFFTLPARHNCCRDPLINDPMPPGNRPCQSGEAKTALQLGFSWSGLCDTAPHVFIHLGKNFEIFGNVELKYNVLST